jgi:cytosine/adenosine deaminase-related metal-dependent hydrolase
MAPVIRLKNVRVALDATRAERIDLLIQRGRILPFDAKVTAATDYDLSGHLLLPGLINAHDHLEFSLFPRLGHGPWPGAREWAAEIYRPECSPVREHRAVPRPVRLIWGGIRNLLSGVTTVAHHNPWEPSTFNAQFPVRVVRRFGWAHSLHFSPDIVERHRKTPSSWPFIVHAAEGTDNCARSEISRLEEIGVLDRRAVVVHAVGATPAQLRTIRLCGAAIVWCPSSNLFTLGATLPASAIRAAKHLVLATDSALTSEGDMSDEIRFAMQQSGLSARDIYPLVTMNPARVLRLGASYGAIAERGMADLIAVRDTGQSPSDALTSLRCEMVMRGGKIMLLSNRLARESDIHPVRRGMHSLKVEGRGEWLVRADVPRLYSAAAGALGGHMHLSGRLVSQ